MEFVGIIIAIFGLVVILLYSGSELGWAISKNEEMGDTFGVTALVITLLMIWGMAIFSIITLGRILVNMGGI